MGAIQQALVGAAWGAASGFENVPTDTKLLLHFDGSNGSTTITDDSGTSKTCVASGDCEISTTLSVFGGSSLKTFGGKVTVTNHADFDTGSGDFTFQFRGYRAALAGGTMFCRRDAAVYCPIDLQVAPTTGIVTLLMANGALNSWSVNQNFGAVFTPGVWMHFALVKSSSTITLYVDGTATGGTASLATMATSSQDLYIGAGPDGLFTGYTDEFVFTADAVWTSNFTPPALAYG